MATIIKPTTEVIRSAYIEHLSKRKADAEAFAKYAEEELAAFIRRHVDKGFTSIYVRTDHNYYDRIRDKIAIDAAMRAEDDAAGWQYSIHLREYSAFLESKSFKNLCKVKQEKAAPKAKSKKPDKEREITEGEKQHVEFERAHRSKALRQACIDKYGYQCQCCGMNFADLYGEELGGHFIEVHHLKMLSTYDEAKPEDYVENLVPLCSNCHSIIHHGPDGPLTLGQLRAAYRGEVKPLKVRKED